jgi:hypothetical protein
MSRHGQIDPLKLQDPNDRLRNIQELRKSINDFLFSILNSLDSLPDEFRCVHRPPPEA